MAGSVVPALISDLADEFTDLHSRLREIPADAWHVPTPATGWSVHDQIAHLAHFDWVTRLSIGAPQRFEAVRDSIADLQSYVDSIGPANLSRDGSDMLAWWQSQNERLRSAAAAADPAVRVPWFGPAMSLASKITARIMETWAHGQDVVDALGMTREPTSRIMHVVRIGALALPNSFRTRNLDVPSEPVRVDVTLPSGEELAFGPEDAHDRVSGTALDFALVVTQRRHIGDTALSVRGPVATSWIEIAQAFAGPPGAGRSAGQFPGSPS